MALVKEHVVFMLLDFEKSPVEFSKTYIISLLLPLHFESNSAQTLPDEKTGKVHSTLVILTVKIKHHCCNCNI